MGQPGADSLGLPATELVKGRVGDPRFEPFGQRPPVANDNELGHQETRSRRRRDRALDGGDGEQGAGELHHDEHRHRIGIDTGEGVRQCRVTDTAGLANDVDGVNQYAPPM